MRPTERLSEFDSQLLGQASYIKGIKGEKIFMAILKLSAPWQIYYKELCELFKHDSEVRIIYDTDEQVINIYVENTAKADAMAAVLPMEKEFGAITVQINVIPANPTFKKAKSVRGTIYEDLFRGNPIVDDIVTIEGVMTNPITYVIFKKEVVQYYNDSLSDAHGMCSTLYQDIAKRVLDAGEGIFFCTNNTMNINYKIPSYTITTSNSYTTM